MSILKAIIVEKLFQFILDGKIDQYFNTKSTQEIPNLYELLLCCSENMHFIFFNVERQFHVFIFMVMIKI